MIASMLQANRTSAQVARCCSPLLRPDTIGFAPLHVPGVHSHSPLAKQGQGGESAGGRDAAGRTTRVAVSVRKTGSGIRSEPASE